MRRRRLRPGHVGPCGEGGEACAAVVGDDDHPAPAQQGEEQTGDREVERECGEERNDRLLVRSEVALLGESHVASGAQVADRHTLGFAGRTRREEQVRLVGRSGCRPVDVGRRRHVGELGEHDRTSGAFHQAIEASCGLFGVEGHVGTTGDERAEDRDHRVDAAAHADADALALGDAFRAQVTCEPDRLGPQVTTAQLAITVVDHDVVEFGEVLAKPIDEPDGGGREVGAGTPRFGEADLVVGADVEGRDRRVGVGDHHVEERGEVPRGAVGMSAVGGRLVEVEEQRCAVLAVGVQLHLQQAAGVDRSRVECEVGHRDVAERTELDAGDDIDQHVVVAHGGEARRGVAHRRHHRLAHPLVQRSERVVGSDNDVDREDLHDGPDDLLGVCSGPVVHGKTD